MTTSMMIRVEANQSSHVNGWACHMQIMAITGKMDASIETRSMHIWLEHVSRNVL